MKRIALATLWVMAVIIVLLFIIPLLIPVPPLRGTLPPEQLQDPDSLFVDVDGLKVHYKSRGSGEPVFLLLHGFGSSTFSWREVMEPMSQYGTIIAFDRPAFGLTERPLPGDWTDGNPYTAEAQVRLTLGLMDRLGIDQATLVGNSAGGTIAVLTAIAAPARVSRLILVSPAIYNTGGSPSWVSTIAALPQVRRIGPLIVRLLVKQLERSLPSAWHDPTKITTDVLEGYKKPLMVDNWDRAFWEFSVAGRTAGLDSQVGAITTPTLVMAGDDDRWVATELSVRLSREMPNATLALIPTCGHVPQEECPGPFMQAVSSFLASGQ